MREIRFRAWDNILKEMCTNFYLNAYGEIIIPDCVYGIDDVLSHYAIMQYVGVKDSKGVEICEGDIVKTDEAGWKAKVVYGRDNFYCVDNESGFSFECDWEQFEIIGNIYETPELLEKK